MNKQSGGINSSQSMFVTQVFSTKQISDLMDEIMEEKETVYVDYANIKHFWE